MNISYLIFKGRLVKTGRGIWVLSIMIFLSSFLLFLNENGYSYNAWGPWVVGLAFTFIACTFSLVGVLGGFFVESLIFAGLITLFIDLRSDLLSTWGFWSIPSIFLIGLCLFWILKRNFYKVANAIFGIFFMVTLAQLVARGPVAPMQILEPKVSNLVGDYPSRIIHLILDEHIGIEGIPTEQKAGRALKRKISKFYQKYGFHVFGGAYSHYSETLDSIPNMLNFSDHPERFIFVKKTSWGGSLAENKYFKSMKSFGFRINVWESTFLKLCSNPIFSIENCKQYTPWDTKALQSFNFPLVDQVTVLFASYIQKSSIYRGIRKAYKRIRVPDKQTGNLLPKWSWDRLPNLGALNAFQAIDRIWEDILLLPSGNFLFAHILFPHSPLVAQSNCSIKKDMGNWQLRENLSHATLRVETYELFFPQVECLYVKLESLFGKMQIQGIWENSLIILQGDHGSRISLHSPNISNQQDFTAQDALDNFSTLFAIKFPHKNATYDTRIVPVEKLLKGIVNDYMKLGRPLSFQTGKPFVYLNSEKTDSENFQSLKAIPYPTLQNYP